MVVEMNKHQNKRKKINKHKKIPRDLAWCLLWWMNPHIGTIATYAILFGHMRLEFS
jgi:hypothetical protein